MDLANLVRALFALIFTVGLVGLAAVALRKLGPDALNRLIPVRKDRRINVVETLVLDPARRLVLVNCDGEDRLLLLGEGRELSRPLTSPPAKTETSSNA